MLNLPNVELKYPHISNALVEFVPIDKIVSWSEKSAMNQRTTYPLDSKQFLDLKANIKRRGIRDPLILRRKTNRLTGFHGVHRYLAAKQLGYKYVPCKIIGHEKKTKNI